MKWSYCKGCKWEFDYKNCKNDYKKDMIKSKDGTLKCGYCMWYKLSKWFQAKVLLAELLKVTNKTEWNEFKKTLLYKKLRKLQNERPS